MNLTFKDVSEILKILDASSCRELVLDVGDSRLVVRRGDGHGDGHGDGATISQTVDVPSASPGSAGTKQPAPVSGEGPSAASPEAPADDGLVDVKAPMTGTFYLAPSPSEPKFVEPGARVAEGDTLALIEVMKLFTPLEAPVAGEVSEILGRNGELVEFADTLIRLRPA